MFDRTAISSIRRNLRDRKCLCSRVNERRHFGTIARPFLPDFSSGNDVRLDSAHYMRFDPLRLFPHPAVFVVKPARVSGSPEAGRVHSEINFHAGQRQAALPNQFAQYRRQALMLKVIENRVVAGDARDHATPVGLPQITHKPTARETGIDLEGRCEHGITQGQARTATALRGWFLNACAEIAQQFLESVLFAKITGKRPSADRFPQFDGLECSRKWECARRDSNPQSCQGSRLKVGCGCQFRHVRVNTVRVGRISGSPLHLSQSYLQFCQLKNLLSVFASGKSADGKRGASSVEPTAFIG